MSFAQLSLFGHEEPAFDEKFALARRTDLGSGAWLEYVPGWLRGDKTLFGVLALSTAWREAEQQMYDRIVRTPRLIAVLPDDGPGHPLLELVRSTLSARYAEDFRRISMAYYRDGNDSVAWHGDRIARRMDSTLVATVSLGSPRRFLIRPYGGGPSRAYRLGSGDLLVMGGTCQRTFQHCIPKVPHADPRISVMFRPMWQEADAAANNDPAPQPAR